MNSYMFQSQEVFFWPLSYSLCTDLLQLSCCEKNFLWIVLDNSPEVNLCKLQLCITYTASVMCYD